MNTTSCGLNTFNYQAANCEIYYYRTSRKLIPYSSSNHFYQNGTDRNAIVTVVIYAILTMFKWCHIDSSLFYIFPPLVMPYASNACTVNLFYVICIDSMGFTLTVNCLFYWCDILTIDNCHVWYLRDWISLYSMCVFWVFFISSIACIISSVTIIQSPNSLLANVTCL